MTQENPCLTCGACCANFRVSFYWGETEPAQGGHVPIDLTEDLPPLFSCMKGTNQTKPHCIALQGEVGTHVRCSIYQNEPSPCRDFGIHWANGEISALPENLIRCNQTRAVYSLPPITITGS